MPNETSITGFLRYPPEMKYTANGIALTTFTIYDTDDKEYKRKQKVVVWAELAEKCYEKLFESAKVFIKGYLKPNVWTDKFGVEQFTTDLVAKRIWELDDQEDEMNRAKELTTE